MDIAERRKPQDGRLKELKNGQEVDFRVNCTPTIFVMKRSFFVYFSDKSNLQADLPNLGFEERDFQIFQGSDLLAAGDGRCLSRVRWAAEKPRQSTQQLVNLIRTTGITTAEDPVEFNLDGVNWFK